jgi:spermidine synthase
MEGSNFIENISKDFALCSKINAIYHTQKSKYQSIQIVDTIPWGKALVLDGHLQSCEKDEFIYHESLVHPVLLYHPNPKKVFVGGGGEGATVREILKHKSIEKVVMVDIDQECVEVCQKYLQNHHQGSLQDSRVQVFYDDAKAWLENTKEKFDVIILDLVDPTDDECGPAILLYTQEFYQMTLSKLNENGMFVTQCGSAGVLTHHTGFTAIQHTLSSVYPRVFSYIVSIPSFADNWGFHIGIKENNNEIKDISKFTTEEIDRKIQDKLFHGESSLKFYDGIVHKGLFCLPKPTRKSILQETKLVTIDSPFI